MLALLIVASPNRQPAVAPCGFGTEPTKALGCYVPFYDPKFTARP